MRRRWNPELLLETAICFSLSVLLLYALISGRVSDYVHPRMNGFLWFSACALFVISIALFSTSCTPKHNAKPSRFFLFLIPVFAAIVIPAGTVQSNAVSFGNTGSPGAVPNAGGTVSQTGGASAASSQSETGVDAPVKPSLPQEDANGLITISDEQYSVWYQDINRDMKSYAGKTLKFKGQVFRMKGFATNEIVPVRYAMVCCTADLQPCGILCRGNGVSAYKNDDWVMITGKIKIETYMNQTMPICYISKIERAEKPETAYIYFIY